MYHHGTGEIMELRAEAGAQPCLETEIPIPGQTLEERVDETDEEKRRRQLGLKAGTLGNAAGNDGGNRSREGEEKEELHQFVAVLLRQDAGAAHEIGTVGHPIANEEVSDGGHGKIGEYLDQGIDLILPAHRAQFEKSKTGVHGKHHDGAQEHEQDICAGSNSIHRFLLSKWEGRKQETCLSLVRS